MKLLLDAGNSRIKLGWTRAGPAPEGQVIALAHAELHTLPARLAELPGTGGAALGVNVAGPRMAERLQAMLAQAGYGVQWVRPARDMLGLRNGYADPAQLGADRWMAVLGVWSALAAPRPPMMLATFGTATTLDTTGPDDCYAGGLILPGPALMRASLAHGTAELPHAAGSVQDYPGDTHAAIVTGVAAAQAGAVLRQWLQALARYGRPPALYVSGGGWPEVQAETQAMLHAAAAARGLPPPAIQYVAHPVLDGLARLAGASCPPKDCPPTGGPRP
ncbi:type III pantothenate kinase [Orrella sp. JC864]|uniref:type III pantothenate kinase n=1 Tax=Orrella sp. JC864 TaxID=3120298 RepID=UPI0030080640